MSETKYFRQHFQTGEIIIGPWSWICDLDKRLWSEPEIVICDFHTENNHNTSPHGFDRGVIVRADHGKSWRMIEYNFRAYPHSTRTHMRGFIKSSRVIRFPIATIVCRHVKGCAFAHYRPIKAFEELIGLHV